jgi:hypothetical protein
MIEMEATDKLVIADEMLDAAIVEYLDHKRYFASLNLAGIAEEIYGNFLKFSGLPNTQRETIDLVRAIGSLEGAPELSDKEWWQIATSDKNAIKHLDSIQDQFVIINALDSSRLMINDALSNHLKLNREITLTIQRFYEFGRQWAAKNSRSEL